MILESSLSSFFQVFIYSSFFIILCFPLSRMLSPNPIALVFYSFTLFAVAISFIPLVSVSFSIFNIFLLCLCFFIIGLFCIYKYNIRLVTTLQDLGYFKILIIFILFFSSAFFFRLSQFHYDYLPAILQSVDLARTGEINSSWLRKVGCHDQFFVAQSLSIALDSFEALITGHISGILSKFLVLSLASLSIINIASVKKNTVSILPLATYCFFIVFDSFTQFRPHAYVGILLALIITEIYINDKYTWIRLPFYFLLLSLAKRDGIVIIGALSLIYLIKFLVEKKNNVFLFLFFIIFLSFTFLGGFFCKIGGQSVGFAFAQSIGAKSILNSFSQWPVIVAFILIVCTTLIFVESNFNLKRINFFIILGILYLIFLVILTSAVLLEGKSRYNEGTIIRKVLYFLTYPCLATQTLIFSQIEGNYLFSLRRFISKYFTIFLIILYIVLFPPIGRKSWSLEATNAIKYYTDLFPLNFLGSIGFFENNAEDWSVSPNKQITPYKFPLLIAFCGIDISFEADCRLLKNKDLVFFQYNAPIEKKKELVLAGFFVNETDSGICVMTKSSIYFTTPHRLMNQMNKPINMVIKNSPLQLEKLKNMTIDSQIAEIPAWNNKILTYVIWPKNRKQWDSPVKIHFENLGTEIFFLEWRPHPHGDFSPTRIRYSDDLSGNVKEYIFSKNEYVFRIPIFSHSNFFIEFYQDNNLANSSWGAPHITLFDFRAITAPY